VKENEVHLKNPTTQQLFKGYFFDKNHHTSPSNTKSTTGGNGDGLETEGMNPSKASVDFKRKQKNMMPPEGVKQL